MMTDRVQAGRDQIEAAILSFPGYVEDNINLSAFMEP